MNPEHKKYILENIYKKSTKEIASFLHLKERVIRRFREKESVAEKPKDFKTVITPRLKDTKTNYFNILAIALLIIIGTAAYSNTLHSPFQFDDVKITNSPYLKDISNLWAIFNFMPTRFITDLSLAINYHFDSLGVFGYHLFNLLIHLCAAIMVWWLVILTLRTPAFKDKKISGRSGIIAFFAALIFVSHPVQTQGVTYIIQRAASLAALFYISSLTFYVKSRLLRHEADKSHIRFFYYTLSFIALILAMFSKEMTITLPFMILLYELCFFREEGIDWKHVIPFFVTLPIIPITMAVTRSVNFGEMRLMRETSPGILPLDYLMTQFRVIVTYIRLLFIPVNQNLDYDYSVSRTLFDMPTLSSLILLAVILIAAVKMFRGYRLVSFGIFFFFLTLIPESSIIPIQDVIFEHRLYLPMVGYAVFLVSAVYYIFENKGIKPVIIILSIAGISYSMLAYNRNFIWKDNFTLWEDVVRKSPNKARPLCSRGNAYKDKGNIDQAISDYNKAIELKPNYADAYNNRGNAYKGKGNIDQAISDYNKAVEVKPDLVEPYNNLGLAYYKTGKKKEAIVMYKKAIEIKPDFAESYNNLGAIYDEVGKKEDAAAMYKKAIEIKPGYAEPYNNLGLTYYGMGKKEEAIAMYKKAIEINPDFAEPYNNLANIYDETGRKEEAIAMRKKVMEINPNHAEPYNNRGLAYYKMGKKEDAIAAWKKAIEINPGYVEPYNNLANIYDETGRKEDAIAMYKRAIEINPDYITAYNNLGATYYGMGKKEGAIAMYKKAIEINPGHAGSYYNLGLTYYGMGKKEDAIAMYKKAIEINPGHVESYYNLGVAYYGMEKKEEAIAMYKRAIEINPDHATAYNNLGVAYFAVDKKEDAAAAFKRALEVNPAYEDARRNLEAIK